MAHHNEELSASRTLGTFPAVFFAEISIFVVLCGGIHLLTLYSSYEGENIFLCITFIAHLWG